MKNEGFTLVELLAVILILAFIAIIAVPIIINIIAEAKYSSTKLSVEYYLDAIEKSLLNNEVIGGKSNDGIYTIKNNGKLISNIDNEIYISYDGNGLEEGIVQIENGKVIRLSKCKINGYYAKIEDDQVNLYKTIKESALLSGGQFNNTISQLVGEVGVTEITFLSDGMLPNGYTKEELTSLKNTSVSSDGSINAYYDEMNKIVYIYSDNYILAAQYSNDMFRGKKLLRKINFNGLDTSNVIHMEFMFDGCNNLEILDLDTLDTGKVIRMSGMFQGCSSLKSLNLSNWDTSSVTGMESMFSGCTNLKKVIGLEQFDTNLVTNMANMFNGCNSLETLDLSSFNTGNVTSMAGMFRNCSGLTELDVSNFDTGKVIDMNGIFWSCINLTEIDVSHFNTSSVENMNRMFNGSTGLKKIIGLENFNTENVDNMGLMFWGCSSLEELDLTSFDISGVTTFENMFSGCKNLKVVKVKGSKWDELKGTTAFSGEFTHVEN